MSRASAQRLGGMLFRHDAEAVGTDLLAFDGQAKLDMVLASWRGPWVGVVNAVAAVSREVQQLLFEFGPQCSIAATLVSGKMTI